MFTDESRITMSIRFEGVSPQELLAIHKIAAESEPTRNSVRDDDDYERPTAQITEAVFEQPSNTYLVQLSVTTFFLGHTCGTTEVIPSRDCLIRIFDALDILPEKKIVR